MYTNPNQYKLLVRYFNYYITYLINTAIWLLIEYFELIPIGFRKTQQTPKRADASLFQYDKDNDNHNKCHFAS